MCVWNACLQSADVPTGGNVYRDVREDETSSSVTGGEGEVCVVCCVGCFTVKTD